ncbi:MAG: Ig-like domain-containing protein [Oscillospiraceae bacterium]|jgi:uncharacterized protein YjdB|nr:Ig-like domain-containing protein [Oscillospiraceae bacterium]
MCISLKKRFKNSKAFLSLLLAIAVLFSAVAVDAPVITAQGVSFGADEYIAAILLDKEHVIVDTQTTPTDPRFASNQFSFAYTLLTNTGNQITPATDAEAQSLLDVTASALPSSQSFLNSLSITKNAITGSVNTNQGVGTLILNIKQKGSTSGVEKNAFVKLYNLNKKLFALTFDDGPTDVTADLLDVLAAKGVSATFFLVGDAIQDMRAIRVGSLLYPELVKREVNEGHDIGNHTYSHPWQNAQAWSEIKGKNSLAVQSDFDLVGGNYFPKGQSTIWYAYSADEVSDQINRQDRLLQSIVGFTPNIYRPIYGYINPPTYTTDKQAIFWGVWPGFATLNGQDRDTNDWRPDSTASSISNTLAEIASRTDPGDVLMHDAYTHTVQGVELFLNSTAAQNLQFVTVSEFFEIKNTLSLPAAKSVTGISLTPNTLTIDTGDSAKLEAEVLPVDATNAIVLWYSENPAIASVDKNGLVTGLSKGVTKVYALSADGKKTEFSTVTVNSNAVEGVSFTLNSDTAYIATGAAITISPLANDVFDDRIDAYNFGLYDGSAITAAQQGAYGNAAVSGDNIIYTPRRILDDAETLTYAYQATSAAGVAADYGTDTASILVYPASCVYYDDSFANSSKLDDVSNGNLVYTIDDSVYALAWSVQENSEASFGGAHVIGNSLSNPDGLNGMRHGVAGFSFKFKGTGFDVISRISGLEGILSYNVYHAIDNGDGTFAKGAQYQPSIKMSLLNLQANYYQVPVASCYNMPHGDYIVEVTVDWLRTLGSTGNYVYIDGVRIYSTIKDDTQKIYELRDLVLNGAKLAPDSTVIGENSVAMKSGEVTVGSDGYTSLITANVKQAALNELELKSGESVSFYYYTENPQLFSLEAKKVFAAGSELTVSNGKNEKSVAVTELAQTIYNFNSIISDKGLQLITITNTGAGAVTLTKLLLPEDAVLRAEPVAATSIAIKPSQAELEAGETLQLSTVLTPVYAVYPTVNWSVVSGSAVSVDNNGLVTALAKGVARVKVSTNDGSLSDEIEINVTQRIHPSGVTAAPKTLQLEVGEAYDLTATVAPADADNKAVTWSSNNTGVVTVDNNGHIIAAGVGGATVTVTTVDGGKTDTVSIDVVKRTLTVLINGGAASVSVEDGSTTSLTAAVTPSTYGTGLTWTSSDLTIAEVNSSGLVTAKKPGTVTITATSTYNNSCSDTIEVTVTKRAVTVSITSGAEVNVSEKLTLTATVTPAVYDTTVTWTVTNGTGAATLAGNVLTGTAVGTVTVKATSVYDNTKYAEKVVEITEITVPTNLTVILEGTSTNKYAYAGSWSNAVGWIYKTDMTSNSYKLTESIAKPTTGTTSKMYVISAIDFYCNQAYSGSADNAIRIDYSSTGFISFQGYKYVGGAESPNNFATGYNTSYAVNGYTVKYTNATNTITITPNGTDVNGSFTTVPQVSATGVTLSGVNTVYTYNLPGQSKTTTLTAAVVPSNATEKGVTWSSSNSNIASVANGVVTGVAAGSATITATTVDGGFTATIVMTVINNTPILVYPNVTSLTPSSAQLDLNGTKDIILIANLNSPTPGSGEVLDASLTWTSSDPTVASVANDGKVTALKVGTATITAKSGNNSTATAAITVVNTSSANTGTPPSNKIGSSLTVGSQAGTYRGAYGGNLTANGPNHITGANPVVGDIIVWPVSLPSGELHFWYCKQSSNGWSPIGYAAYYTDLGPVSSTSWS